MSTPVIGLAGGIGAGKSAAAAVLAELGCVVADADQLAKAALDAPDIRAQVVAWWGKDMLDADGCVDRGAVAAIVFEQPDALQQLEGLVHPEVERQRSVIFNAAPEGTRALVIDAPLLFEVELEQLCDMVIFIEASREVRLDRLARNRGWNVQELDRREAKQLALDTKRSLADHIVVNEGGPEALRAALVGILDTLPDN